MIHYDFHGFEIVNPINIFFSPRNIFVFPLPRNIFFCLERGKTKVKVFYLILKNRLNFLFSASWSLALKETLRSNSLVECAVKCQSKEESESLCNAFRYLDADNYCYLSKVEIF